MIPQRLASAGYRSIHIGKWHQGFFTPDYTPVGRGFHKSVGFLEGGEDHNSSKTFGNWCKKNEVDLSFGAAGGDKGDQPYPYLWPATCTEWETLPNVALHEFFDHDSKDVGGYNPWTVRKFDDQVLLLLLLLFRNIIIQKYILIMLNSRISVRSCVKIVLDASDIVGEKRILRISITTIVFW